MTEKLSILRASLDGDLFFDDTMRVLYATDASIYRELPLAVALPRHKEDVLQLIQFARQNGVSLIPRTAGTSLAGQCVGSGIVVDVSRYMNRVLEINAAEGWVRVEPGVIRDDLNVLLRSHGLYFGPNTSTSNRAMIGGMVGNNSCGSYSIVYGSTRDHVQEVTAFLSDGSEVVFGEMNAAEFRMKTELQTLEGAIYRQMEQRLSQPEVRAEIRKEYPHPAIPRRNTGYAVDYLLDFFEANSRDTGEHHHSLPLHKGESEGVKSFSFCPLLAGSEGTLAFFTEIKIHCNPLPPKVGALMCVHFDSLEKSLTATVTAMQFAPRAVELMDDTILQCTKANIEQRKNRFFLQGDPASLLVIEVGGETEAECNALLDRIEAAMRAKGEGYHFPRVYGADIKRVWALRAAGLGVLSNIPDAPRPIEIIEDTAVRVEDLPAYIRDFGQMMDGFGRRAIYYAHAGAGELHLRPMVSLRTSEDRVLMRQIAEGSAKLVKAYNGSLSGEHGDGRVRGEFIPLMLGEKNYALLQEIKATWDEKNIFNPGKIVNAPPMDTDLRFIADYETPDFNTIFDFGKDGILALAEKCNGSGDCRKTEVSGGTMCPSYMATRNEKDTTRARANILREFLTRSPKANRFDHQEIYEVLDLCLSCKGCSSECPSNVDMATLKAEFLHQYYRANGVPIRAKAIANISRLNKLGMLAPSVANFFLQNAATSTALKSALGIAPKRSLPALAKTSLRRQMRHLSAEKQQPAAAKSGKVVYFFVDEFTDYNDAAIGKTAIELLQRLGYQVIIPAHVESGRAYFSKGLLPKAQALARQNVALLASVISAGTPLVGIEPSAILSFRDEYPKLVEKSQRETATALGKNCLTIEEFLAREMAASNIRPEQFTTAPRKIMLHGHCHQKSLSSVEFGCSILSLPANYSVEVIPSGCCGMAGSFGYEAEHYDVSMQIGELVLFPAVRSAAADALIVAAGTSCRHQIHDGTSRHALHPVQVLFDALV